MIGKAATVTLSQSITNASIQETRTSVRAAWRDYIEVTKPKHQFVLFTCWVTMRLASADLSLPLVFFTLLGTGFAVASSHVFNQILDRDVDAKMERTANRPLAASRLSVGSAVVFGIVLLALSLGIMIWQTNLLSTLLVLAGWFIYVVPYTYWLKRRSPWCTLAGGFSGAMPTLIGWTAVTGQVAVVPLLFYALMTIWQTPHFFALSLFREEDYRKAGLAVVVVRHGKAVTLLRILLHVPLLVICSLLIYFAGVDSILFLTVALIVGGLFTAGSIKAYIDGVEEAPKWGKRLFPFSYAYLFLIYIAAAFHGPVV